MPKISFILPVYNVENYLRKCMESIVQQTLADIEIICVDDCSTDNSLAILREYEANDKRVKVISLSENIKQGGARNRALDIAVGEFISFVDSDDFIDIHLAEDMYQLAIKTNADMVRGKVSRYYSDDEQYIEEDNFSMLTLERDELQKRIIVDGGRLWGGIVRRSILEKNKIRFPEGIVYEDNAIGTLIWLHSKIIKSIVRVYYYYRCSHQSSTRVCDLNKLSDRLETSAMFLDNMKTHGFYNGYKPECDYRYIFLAYYSTTQMAFQHFTPPAYQYIKRGYCELCKLVPDFSQNPYLLKKLSLKYRFIYFTIMPINAKIGVFICKSLNVIRKKLS